MCVFGGGRKAPSAILFYKSRQLLRFNSFILNEDEKAGNCFLQMLMHFGFFQSQLAVLSGEAKDAAAAIEAWLQLGTKLSDVVTNKSDALGLFDLFRDEGYILTEHEGRFCI
ncbi:hypothetical protein RHMOL_Rhmol09G0081000 [Rhododendron molle]|nr:hypothetical protein RHMOL_Rhmol09G0081000 [Rhododendron molle]